MISFVIEGIGLTVPQYSIILVAKAIVRFTRALWVGVAIRAVDRCRTRVPSFGTLVGRSGNRGGGRGWWRAGFAVFHLPRLFANFCFVIPDVWGAGVDPGCAEEAQTVFRFATFVFCAELWILMCAIRVFRVCRTIIVIALGFKLDMSRLQGGQENQT